MSLLLGTIALPGILAVIIYVLGKRIGERAAWISLICLAFVTTPIILVNMLTVYRGLVYEETFFWAPIEQFKFGLLLDGLSSPIVLTMAVISAIIVAYSPPYMKRRILEIFEEEKPDAHATYYSLYLLCVIGMIGTVLSTNLVEFYLFFELMVVPAWALINSFGYKEKEKIALMFFLWTHAGAVSLVMGIFLAYTRIGSFEIADLVMLKGDPMAMWIAVLMLLGFLVKMAAFGLHIWLPYAYAEAPTSISALLSSLMTGIGAYGIVRIILTPLNDVAKFLSIPLAIWALINMIYGALMALIQDDIKKLLAYSSISQMGYLLLGISSFMSLGVSGAMFHYVSHGLGKAILFAVAGILICQAHGIRSITKLGGLTRKMPITTTVFIIGFLGLAGIPPTSGFISKVLIFAGIFSSAITGGTLYLLIATLAMIATILTVAYALWAIRKVFFGPLPKHFEDVKEAPYTMTIPLLILAIMLIILGIYPRPVTDLLLSVATTQIKI